MEAIVLAGGFGTRLAQVVKDVPKPMAPVVGRPFLTYILDDLAAQNVERVVLAVCHKKEIIMEYFGGSYHGLELVYSIESIPLYTGGAIRQAMTHCREERVSIINGDTYFQVDLKRLRSEAVKRGDVTAVAVKRMQNFSRYGRVDVSEAGCIVRFREKEYSRDGLINGGIYDMEKDTLDQYPQAFSLENAYFPDAMKAGELIAVPFNGLFIDIGIPRDYERAQELFRGLSR